MESKDFGTGLGTEGTNLSLLKEAHETPSVVQALFPSLHDNQLIRTTHPVELIVVVGLVLTIISLMEPMKVYFWAGVTCFCLRLDDKDWYPPIAVGFLALCSVLLGSITALLCIPKDRMNLNSIEHTNVKLATGRAFGS